MKRKIINFLSSWTINWGGEHKPKYFSYVFGSGWERGEFKFFDYRKVPLGWSANVWRFSFSYDDFDKVRSNRL
jgi:hypothetical protein